MKARTTLMVVGLVACSLAASAQTNTPTAEAVDAVADTNAPAETVSAETVVAESVVGTAPATDVAPEASQIIPLIVMDDVPLTDAIKNLARQAGLNYMLDPKLAYGQIGADGKLQPQPSVSIRWENVTAEQALGALLNNYNLQLQEDQKTKISRITVRDPAAPDPLVTKIIQLKYANPSNIVAAVNTALDTKRSRVVPDIRTSQLVLSATERELMAVEKMIERLDSPTRQVLIEARLLETSMNPRTVKGFDWNGTLSAQNIAAGNNVQHGPVPGESDQPPLATLWPKLMLDTARGFNPSTAFLDADGVNLVFSFINNNSEARVLSAPRTVTLDNETAHIAVTRASPIINVTPGTSQTTGGSQILYTNLGVILDVTPRISANNYVNLKVVPEVSRVFDRIKREVGVLGTVEADEYDVRKIVTSVMIPSGNTLVLGGLVQDDERFSSSKVPLVGDVPVLGHLFRSSSKSRQKANLLVFITPTIVEETDFQPTKSDFLKAPVPQPQENPWSVWDSTKPLDWSKPLSRQFRPGKQRHEPTFQNF